MTITEDENKTVKWLQDLLRSGEPFDVEKLCIDDLEHYDIVVEALSPTPPPVDGDLAEAVSKLQSWLVCSTASLIDLDALLVVIQAATSQQALKCRCCGKEIHASLKDYGSICSIECATKNNERTRADKSPSPEAERLAIVLRDLRQQTSDFFDYTIDQGWVDDDCDSDGIALLKDAIKNAYLALADFEKGGL